MEIMFQGIPYENINSICLSETLNKKTLSLTRNNVAKLLSTYIIKKVFLTTTDITPDNDATNSSPPKKLHQRNGCKKSTEKYLLTDSANSKGLSVNTVF